MAFGPTGINGATGQAIVAVVFFVHARGHLLIRGQLRGAGPVQNGKFVVYHSHPPVDSSGVVCKVHLVLELNDDGVTVAALKGNEAPHFHQPETIGIKNAWISNGLEQEISVGHIVAIVVEALAHIAQIKPDAFQHYRGAGMCGIGGLAPAQFFVRISSQKFGGHFGGGVGPYLVGVGSNDCP